MIIPLQVEKLAASELRQYLCWIEPVLLLLLLLQLLLLQHYMRPFGFRIFDNVVEVQ